MDKDTIVKLVRRRLKLGDQEWSLIENNPKFQRLFANVVKAVRYRLVAEVIKSKGCNTGHVLGQKLVFDSAGNLLTKEKP